MHNLPYGTKFYMEFNFTILQSGGRNVNLKLVNYVDENLLYITMTLSTKLGFYKIKNLSIFNLNDLKANYKILLP